MPRKYNKVCPICSTSFKGGWDRKYCSSSCRIHAFAQGFADYSFGQDICPVCNSSFQKKSGVHKVCSDSCKGKWKYLTGVDSTENQYKKISGNWYKYFQRLTCVKKREALTPEMLIDLLEQQDRKGIK